MFDAILRFSVKKKLFVGLTTLFLLIGGIYSMLTLPIDAVPDITNNQVQIVTVSPTLAPQEVEQLITMPVEIAMSNIMNVTEIRSVSRFGLSVVTVVFKESVPTLDARQLVNEQIQSVAGEIPSELGMPEMMPVLQKLFTQLNNFIHINQKAAASAAAFLYSVTYPGAFVQIFSQQQLLPLFVQAAVCVSHNQAICIFLHLHSVPSVPA